MMDKNCGTGRMMLKQRRQRWRGMQHQPQRDYLRVKSGSKDTQTSSTEDYAEAKKMILIAEDNRPAALTLWPF